MGPALIPDCATNPAPCAEPDSSHYKQRGTRLRNLYTPYRTPEGCHDVPFIYLFDGNDLTNGTDQVGRLSVKLDSDSQFILRRIAGAQSVGQFFSYRNNSGSYVWQPPMWTLAPNGMGSNQGDISVAPEKIYGGTQAAGQIRFDVLTVAKAVALSGGTDFLAYIAFQGVKRFPWDVEPAPCAYRTRSYEYVLNIPAVDWVRGEYRRFNIKIENTGDFELESIVQLDATNVPTVRTGVFNYMLYDPHKWQMMSLPVPDSYITDSLNTLLTTDPATMPGVFPCPAMLYPRLSQIIVDLYATQSTPQGDCFQIMFRGRERIPLRGDAPVYA